MLVGIVIITALALAGVYYAIEQAKSYLQTPLALNQAELVTITPGTSFNRAIGLLVAQGWLSETPYLRLLPKLYPELTNVKAGTYQLVAPLTAYDALAQFTQGKEHQFTITLVEGSRFSEWRQQLAQAPHLTHQLTELSEAEIAAKLGVDREKLEGLFLAETYHYTAGTTDVALLQRAQRNLERVLKKHWAQRDAALPLRSEYDALTLASIIEKETAIASERSRVASVFINRLNLGMRLQTDPTVIYGMGEAYDGNIRKKDLRTATPYNTYMINGLPPTPIAMVGEAAIAAALSPEQSDYLYFVASGRGDHVFSKTLAEHNRAVRAYLKVLRNQ
nr:endolytic transglycosylase MltG [Vibrio agarilyticus]